MTISLAAEATEDQVAENVATLLHRAGLRQKGLAHQVGMTEGTMSRRMHREQPWLFREVVDIAEFFDVTLEELAGDLPPLNVWRARRDSNPKPSDP